MTKEEELFTEWFKISDFATKKQDDFFRSIISQYEMKGFLSNKQIDAGWQIVEQNEEQVNKNYSRNT